MDKKAVSSSASSGIGFTGLLTITFIVLKLTKVINWSWVWILSPIWISISVGLLILVLIISLIVFLGRSK